MKVSELIEELRFMAEKLGGDPEVVVVHETKAGEDIDVPVLSSSFDENRHTVRIL